MAAGESARATGAQVKDAFGDKKGMKGLVLTDTESGARRSPLLRERRLLRHVALLAQRGEARGCACQRARARAHRSAPRSCHGRTPRARAAAARPPPVHRLSARVLSSEAKPHFTSNLPDPVTRARAPGEERKLQVRGLFYGIGHMPNSGIVAGQVELDAAGYVKAPPPALALRVANPTVSLTLPYPTARRCQQALAACTRPPGPGHPGREWTP